MSACRMIREFWDPIGVLTDPPFHACPFPNPPAGSGHLYSTGRFPPRIVRHGKITQGTLALAEALLEQRRLCDEPLHGQGETFRDMCECRPDVLELGCRFPHRAPDVLTNVENAHGYVTGQCLAQDDGAGLPVLLRKRFEHRHLAGIVAPPKGGVAGLPFESL